MRELKESCEIESFKESRALLYEKLVISFEGRSLPFSYHGMYVFLNAK